MSSGDQISSQRGSIYCVRTGVLVDMLIYFWLKRALYTEHLNLSGFVLQMYRTHEDRHTNIHRFIVRRVAYVVDTNTYTIMLVVVEKHHKLRNMVPNVLWESIEVVSCYYIIFSLLYIINTFCRYWLFRKPLY